MNEQNNTALIKKVYAAFAQGDIQTILDHLAPDVEWVLEGPAIIPFAGRRSGISGALEFFEALGSTQQDQKLTTDEFVAQGDQVATVGRYSAVVTATGKAFDGPVAHFFTIREGRITKFIDITDTAQMADAYTLASSSASR